MKRAEVSPSGRSSDRRNWDDERRRWLRSATCSGDWDRSMEVVTGALPNVIAKLGHLLVGEYNLQKGEEGDIMFLKTKLESMKDALEKLSSKPGQLGIHDKIWATDLRELSYDIEDSIDAFMLHGKDNESAKLHGIKMFGGHRSADLISSKLDQLGIQDKIWGSDLKRELSYDIEDSTDTFMMHGKDNESTKMHGIKMFSDHRSGNLLTTAEIRRWIATEVKDIKSRLSEVHERRLRYDINKDIDKPTAAIMADPRLFAQYIKARELVGIDETRDDAKDLVDINEMRDELIKVLMDENEVHLLQGKIVSIVGFAGLGKTTLAKAVYEKIRGLFDCCAFVSVSHTPKLKKIFKELFYDLSNNIGNSEETGDERWIDVVREFLKTKRYLIVIDDIWDISVWKVIKCALPVNDGGSIVITTTRHADVAEKIGDVYKLKPLPENNSRKLLYRRVFGNENNNDTEDIWFDMKLAEVSDKILKKCAGVPLAIITIANMLTSKERYNMDYWYDVCNSIGTGLENNHAVWNMRNILSYSYYNMPFHLRTCMLYISMFPKDYEIAKDRLIWMWIAEGFIKCEKQEGKSLFELGESYFNELIKRNMIEPLYATGDIVYGCRVHHMMLDLICSLSREENFVTIPKSMDHRSLLQSIRRLSLQNGDEGTLGTRSLQNVRSFVVFPSAIAISVTRILRRFEVLRVLELQGCDLSQSYSLKDIGNLFHLRYLGLRSTRIAHLPYEIGSLQFLQVLDIWNNNISRLPSTVVQLRQLMCLYTDKSTRVPKKIGSLTSLQELSTLRIDNYSMDIIEELGKLIELRVLNIVLFDGWNSKLVECLCKLQKIQDLNISASGDQRDDNSALDAWVAPRHRLRSLNTRRGCWFSRLPSWMNPLLLPDLSSLSIAVRELDQADLKILGKLPGLRCLDLTVDHRCLGSTGKFVITSSLFPCLVQCRFFGFLVPVMFQQGAMPRLSGIEMEFQVKNIRGNIIDRIGLGNLQVIQDVTILFNCKGASEWDLMEAEAAVRHVVELHPSRPTLQIVADGFVGKPVTTNDMKGADLIGIEEAVNELTKILTEGNELSTSQGKITEGNELSTSQGKIVSIVGLGGLGKTTLARAIYGKLRVRSQFDCCAFVSMSQNPDMMKLFKCMLCQFGKKNSANIREEILDDRPLIVYDLTEFLQNRRYFSVIDDIQDILDWKKIECALPASNGGCIIITTTRISDVAKQIGGAYRMRHLCLEDSRILLHRRIFGTEEKGKYVDHELIEISEKILQRCGGIPLAIIMISGLLASKGGNKIEWDKVYRSMKHDGSDDENMKTIVSLCYEDLQSHLKPCLLYLSVFPEGYDIEKYRLIQLWIGEGLIELGKQNESPFELGESYFQELINRCMIQPVYKRWYYDMTECCHVHDMVLDLISEVTGKEKFVSDRVHWLSLQQNSKLNHATHWATMNMQGVRSVFVFPSAVKLLPDLANFRDLLVLDLQSCCLSQGSRLKHLGNLVHLRYLGLRDTGISHLPEEVGKLECLQTFDVGRNEISSLPSTVNELRHLMCLRIDSWTRAPNGIGSFTSLEELSTLCIQDSTDVIEELCNLTELRVLVIDCCTEWNIDEVEKSLVKCLHKLQKIRTLSISMVSECNFDAWVAPRRIHRLELTGCWPSPVPALLNNSWRLMELSFLSMEVRKLRQEDLQSIGRLPTLRYLDIEVSNQKLGTVQTFVIGACSFRCLVHCTLRGYIRPVAFQEGAMPEAARLHLAFSVSEIRETAGTNGGFDDMGFGNLPQLQDVSFLLRRGGASNEEVKEAEKALRQAIERHPNHPTLEIL